MKPSQVIEALRALVPLHQPAFLWGPPGVGKSAIIRQTADALYNDGQAPAQGAERPYLRDVRAVLLDPVDLRGIPRINGDGRAHWCPPEFLPRDGEGVFFLDELNAAPPLVQAGCYQLVLDRRLGEYSLPEGWSILAAGNRETDRAVTHRMPSALANRFLHLDFDADLEDWVGWALQAALPIEVIAFLRFRPGLLHSFDPARNDKAFPTPRSWEFVSKILPAAGSNGLLYDLVRGAVGEGAAAEFVGFIKIFRQLPNPDHIILDPLRAQVPSDPATLYALCGALARKASEQNFGRIADYAGRLPAEFSVLLVRDAVRINQAVVQTRAFTTWASKHKDVLL